MARNTYGIIAHPINENVPDENTLSAVLSPIMIVVKVAILRMINVNRFMT
jgi:hypothetical protein